MVVVVAVVVTLGKGGQLVLLQPQLVEMAIPVVLARIKVKAVQEVLITILVVVGGEASVTETEETVDLVEMVLMGL
ncbi:hypothetical protein GCM10027395_20840 [Giesbergeria sinuosa]